MTIDRLLDIAAPLELAPREHSISQDLPQEVLAPPICHGGRRKILTTRSTEA
jgi:hypothetical protein